ncbi:YfcC family protein [Amylibacter sp. SFDW26]|uniref:YfcC family protein n=1 Tax=Amylibacter sp. SFDW26 TaxID=2652722 RepID=UPI00126250B1|nr:YfcC family protein [Amylibacter sp. SFDW26]KAB7614423.1 YfcC family protein [Amylibacter sp. SFDW26]
MPDAHIQQETSSSRADLKDRFPSAFSILFVLILVMSALTWIIPAGQYDRVSNQALGKDVPIPGTYQVVESTPQSIIDVFLAPIAGFYDPSEYIANAIDVSLFVLVIGGFLGVVNQTGAINTGITSAMTRMKGREKWMIPILMALFALGGTTYGMAEETLAFYAILIPVMIAAGYDAVTGVAVILIGAGIGVLGSTINPFATTIASNAAGIPFTDGMPLRLAILILGWVICTAFVMRYAERVKDDPSRSIVADRQEDNITHFLGAGAQVTEALSKRQTLVLFLFVATFAVMVWGVALQGWWMAEMSALFLAASLVVGIAGWIGEKPFVEAFVNGARDLLGVALIIGLARGIVVVMDAGKITDTILFTSEEAISGYSDIVFINAMYWIEVLMSFLVPSTSGLAVLTMPILAPLSDFAGVERDLAVTAYQSASGIVNLITPTSAVVVGGLAIGRVPYNRWLKFIAPLLLILTVFIMVCLSIGVVL